MIHLNEIAAAPGNLPCLLAVHSHSRAVTSEKLMWSTQSRTIQLCLMPSAALELGPSHTFRNTQSGQLYLSLTDTNSFASPVAPGALGCMAVEAGTTH